MKLSVVSIAILLFLSSCEKEEEKVEILPEYSTVKIQPEQDSLFINENNETRQLSLAGAIVNVTEKTITNTGVMTDIQYTVRTVDTVFQSVNPASAQWYSTNPAIATVINGLVTGKSSGYTQITARVGNAYSKAIVVNVRAVNTEPGLSLAPPDIVFIMQNSVYVSGVVQQTAKLRISEPISGFTDSAVAYSSDGSFIVQVTGLTQGHSTITARAVNANDSTLASVRVKNVIYYEPFSFGADSIVGAWLGTTIGKNFNFSISKNSLIPLRYDIDGTIDIDFKSLGLGLGFVQDIKLFGVLNHDGTIDIALSKETQGFKISGRLDGHFTSMGKGNGSYRAEAIRSGWPKISFNDEWTAVKVP
ncbi:MAG: Ig-like domain-containing protein [Bacteriovoracaceae bacterium]|nr:Ig-like domain-containing protein [Bacteroidota bacterium]